MFVLSFLNGIFLLFAIRGTCVIHYKRSKGWLQGQWTISAQSSINSRIIDWSASNCDQLNHVFHGFLYFACWFPKPIATAQEPLIYQHILHLFAPPWTVLSTALIRDLNVKLSDCVLSRQIALAKGGTVLFATCSIDTVQWLTIWREADHHPRQIPEIAACPEYIRFPLCRLNEWQIVRSLPGMCNFVKRGHGR